MVIRITTINNFFTNLNDQSILRKADNAYVCNRVKSVQYDGKFRYAKGTVQASQKNQTYDVQIWITESFQIEKVECTCARGLVVCHHIGALLLFLHYKVTRTQLQCKWIEPTNNDAEGNDIREIFDLAKYSDYNPFIEKIGPGPIKKKRQRVTDNFDNYDGEKLKENFRKKLESYDDGVGFTWMFSEEFPAPMEPVPLPPLPNPETETVESPAFKMESLIYSANFSLDQLTLSEAEIKDIEESTRGQRTNPQWFLEKKFRLSASNFGKIIGAIGRNKYPPSLFNTLRGLYHAGGARSIRWGVDNELSAIEQFQNRTGLQVRQVGLHVHPNGLLAASPDGIVLENGEEVLIEVKCPYTYRKKTVDEIWLKDKSALFRFFTGIKTEADLKKINKRSHDFHPVPGRKDLFLDKKHAHFHQIQGQLHIAKKKICKYVVWTTVDIDIKEFKLEPTWKVNLQSMEEFYINKFIPELLCESVET